MSLIVVVTMVQRRDMPSACASLKNIADLHAPEGDAIERLILLNDDRDPELECSLKDASNGRILTPGRNLGVACGRNALVAAAINQGADYILSIDDDILAPPDFASRLVEAHQALSRDHRVGILTPATLDFRAVKSVFFSDDEIKALQAGDQVALPDMDEAVALLVQREALNVDAIYHVGIRDWRGGYLFAAPGDDKILQAYGCEYPAHPGGASNLRRAPEALRAIETGGEPIPIDTAPGGICFYSSAMFEDVGGVDETFNPFGYEDADFALRARRQGYEHFAIPRAVAVHDIAGRLKARDLTVLKATSGKFAGAVVRRHLDGPEAVAACLAMLRRTLTDIGADGAGAADATVGKRTLTRLSALFAYISNLIVFLVQSDAREEDVGFNVEAIGARLRTLLAAAFASVDGDIAASQRVAKEAGGVKLSLGEGLPQYDLRVEDAAGGKIRLRLSRFQAGFPKEDCPPLIADIALGDEFECLADGDVLLSEGRNVALRGFNIRVPGVIQLKIDADLILNLSTSDQVGAINVERADVTITDSGALPQWTKRFARLETLAPAQLIEILLKAYEGDGAEALARWLTGETDMITLRSCGKLDGAPRTPTLSVTCSTPSATGRNVRQTQLLANLTIAEQSSQAMMPESLLRRAKRVLTPDPSTAPFPDAYNPSSIVKIANKAKYMAASRGIALSPNERRMLKFQNYADGRRAFIIGNGPSLNELDLTHLKDEITFGVNAIYLNKDKMGFLPTHYIVEDVFVAEDRSPEINALYGPTKWIGNYLSYCLKGDDRTCWLNVACDYSNYSGFPHFSQNASRIVWVGGTVSYIAMQLAYFMGFEQVYLVGFDHSYSVPSDAEVDGRAITSQSEDPNHFHPDYFGKGYRWHDPRVDRMEIAYRRARAAYEAAGRRILNATAGGHLEVFSRVDYKTLF